jgi:hypothetical protein
MCINLVITNAPDIDRTIIEQIIQDVAAHSRMDITIVRLSRVTTNLEVLVRVEPPLPSDFENVQSLIQSLFNLEVAKLSPLLHILTDPFKAADSLPQGLAWIIVSLALTCSVICLVVKFSKLQKVSLPPSTVYTIYGLDVALLVQTMRLVPFISGQQLHESTVIMSYVFGSMSFSYFLS